MSRCILSPCVFNFYAEYTREMLGWMKHKKESRLLGEISIISDMKMIPPLWQKAKRNKVPLDEGERGEWKKTGLKFNIQKTKIMASGYITIWQIDGETMETVTDVSLWAPNSLQRVTVVIKLKDCCHLEKSYDKLDSILNAKTLLCQQRSVQSKLWFFH